MHSNSLAVLEWVTVAPTDTPPKLHVIVRLSCRVRVSMGSRLTTTLVPPIHRPTDGVMPMREGRGR